MSRGTFFTFILTAVLACQALAQRVNLSYASTMPPEQAERLEADIQELSALRFADASGELKRIMQLPDTRAASLESWLALRAHVVVGESFKITMANLVAVEPILTTVAQSERPQLNPQFNPLSALHSLLSTGTTATAPQRPRVIMSNLGTALYAMGKQNGVVLGVKLHDDQGIVLRSPRAGLFQVGEGLFQTLHPRLPASSLADPLHVAFRLGTLFHEARHDDGNNSSLGFMHTLCPAGHDFAGAPACDTSANGPYRIGALFFRGIIEACGPDGCRPGFREVLTMMYADSMSRILSPLPTEKIGLGADLCARLNAVQANNTICNAPAVAAAPIEWDDTPEFIPESP